jgi:hypothetical protein
MPKRQATNRSDQRDPDRRAAAPDPQVSNHDHPSAAGAHGTVPGAGIVRSSADAGPVETSPDRGEGSTATFPGHGTGPLNAPNAMPESDRNSGAPLSAPTDTVGPQPGPSGIRETSDPNYTAAAEKKNKRAQKSRGRKGR